MKVKIGFFILALSIFVFQLKIFSMNLGEDLGQKYINIVTQKDDVRVEVALDPALSTFITSLDQVKHLVEMKHFDVNTNLKFEKGTMRPLHFAAYHNKLSIVEYLIGRGAQIDAKDSFGNTPLYHAILGAKNQDTLNVIKFLVNSGAEIRRIHVDKCVENKKKVCKYLIDKYDDQQKFFGIK